MKKYSFVFILLLFFILSSCSEDRSNPLIQSQTQTLVYQKPGLVDSIVGTCSTYLIRTFILDTLDFRMFNSMRFERNSFTNGNLSEVNIYYVNNDTAVSVLLLQGLHQINSTNISDVPSPKIKTKFYLRMKLFASVCTGDFYHLKLRDIKVFGVN